jgi:hypothetical protein
MREQFKVSQFILLGSPIYPLHTVFYTPVPRTLKMATSRTRGKFDLEYKTNI